jgi:hypothetical protein
MLRVQRSAMTSRKTPLIARSAASPECSKLIDDMMNAACSGRDGVKVEDLAKAAFSIMCFALAKIPDSNARDELLKTLPEEAVTAVAEIVRVSGKIAHEQKKH